MFHVRSFLIRKRNMDELFSLFFYYFVVVLSTFNLSLVCLTPQNSVISTVYNETMSTSMEKLVEFRSADASIVTAQLIYSPLELVT